MSAGAERALGGTWSDYQRATSKIAAEDVDADGKQLIDRIVVKKWSNVRGRAFAVPSLGRGRRESVRWGDKVVVVNESGASPCKEATRSHKR